MKLRNKKTGEIVTLDSDHNDSLADFGGKLLIETRTGKDYSYDTLARLIEDWEDCKPVEPQIKDKYPREAVRNWAEVVGGKDDISVTVGYDRTAFRNKYGAEIIFTRVLDFTDGAFYEGRVLHRSITKLCGEEE